MSRIPNAVWAFVFGIVLTVYVGAIAFRYFPSPLELLGDVGTECQQAAVHKQQEAKGGHTATESGVTRLQNGEADKLKDTAEYEKNVNECLIAKYTGNLAQFTRWLVLATALLAAFGFWQVVISRDMARRQLRAYVSDKPFHVNIDAGEKLSAIIRLKSVSKNHGQTPAMEVSHYNFSRNAFGPLPDDVYFPPPRTSLTSRAIIFPGGDQEVDGRELVFTAKELADLAKEGNLLYILAATHYKDIFGIGRRTRVCIVIKGAEFRDHLNRVIQDRAKTGKPVTLPIDFEFAGQYNDAD